MKLNRKVEYALIALSYMRDKRPGELTSVKEISQHFGTSFDLNSRVLQKLASQRVLRSVQGAQGGYQIVKDLSEVSFYSLISWLTDSVGVTRCVQENGGVCEIQASCNIVAPIQRLNDQLKNFYSGLSLAALLDGTAAMSNKTPAKEKHPAEGSAS